MKFGNLSWNRMIIMVFSGSIPMSWKIYCYQMKCLRYGFSHKTPNTFISCKTMNHQNDIFCLFTFPSLNVAKCEVSH